MKKAIVHDLLALGMVIFTLLLRIPYLNLLAALILILIYTYKKQGIKAELGFARPDRIGNTIIMGALLAIVIVASSYFLMLPLFEMLTGQPLALGIFEQLRGNTGLLLTSLALGWIVGGLIEEIIFRAFFISRCANMLSDKISVVIGAILSSTLFGYLHTYQGPSGQLLTGFVGLILATIYIVNYRNIWLNVFTHGFVNTFGMLLLYFDVIKLG
ncbi:MAG: CPBP family intramembrane glutamic endopeptidase [Cyclobacteriaceae bacterium]